jgi:aspartate-semialdehyde dehydrogenase
VRLKTKQPLGAAACEVLLREAPGVVVLEGNQYPTAAEEGNGSDAVYVGRIREDLFDPRVLHLWVVADNVRKGAALNAVEIAELLLEREVLCGED